MSIPAEASITPGLMQSNQMQLTGADQAVTITVAPQSAHPLMPTGCSCGQCTKTEELLQRQLPAF
ncbi:MAG: hypothetical protein ACKO24_03240 [Leptolyngbyaceae cyanobacterium]